LEQTDNRLMLSCGFSYGNATEGSTRAKDSKTGSTKALADLKKAQERKKVPLAYECNVLAAIKIFLLTVSNRCHDLGASFTFT
jgi:hypothetical protein